jgi:hypothetical protein
MTDSEPTTGVDEPTPRDVRRAVVRALFRAAVTAALLIALYYVVPMKSAMDTKAVVGLILALLALAAIIVWRVRDITRSEHPGLRAIQTLAIVVPLFILAFAATYYLAERANGSNFSEPLTRSGALYFSVTVFSTVGFGDITAKTDGARLVVTAQMFLDLLLLGFGARVFVGAVKLGRQRHSPSQP